MSPVQVMVELLQPKDGAQQEVSDPITRVGVSWILCECVYSLLVTCRHSEPSFFWSGGCKRQMKMGGRCTHSLPTCAGLLCIT